MIFAGTITAAMFPKSTASAESFMLLSCAFIPVLAWVNNTNWKIDRIKKDRCPILCITVAIAP
jgi:hypothetical protein